MRWLGMGIIIVLSYVRLYGQSPTLLYHFDSTSKLYFESRDWRKLDKVARHARRNSISFYDLCYRLGVSNYMRKKYAISEYYFKKCEAYYRTDDVASYLYWNLANMGLTLEAKSYASIHRFANNTQNSSAKLIEQYSVDMGTKIPDDPSANDPIYFGQLSIKENFGIKNEAFQSLSFMQQANKSNAFSQLDFAATAQHLIRNNWYLTGSLHYAHTTYEAMGVGSSPYQDSISNSLPNGSTSTTKYLGVYDYNYQIPGQINFLSGSTSLTKRIGPWVLGVEPSVLFIANSSQTKTDYSYSGTVDSFFNSVAVGSGTFFTPGSITSDSTWNNLKFQIGLSGSYNGTVLGIPLYTRVSCLFIPVNGNVSPAIDAYLYLPLSASIVMHSSFFTKAEQPVVLNAQGQYLSDFYKSMKRIGLTMQLLPQKKWSPMLTLQAEQNKRAIDNLSTNFYSIFLTVKHKI